jgi:hypothetical protein
MHARIDDAFVVNFEEIPMSTSRSYPQRLLFPRQAAPRPLRLSLRARSTPGRLRHAARSVAELKRLA